MTSLESASSCPLTLKFRCVEGYGCPAENSPVEVSEEFGWITWRMLLSSNGPPLRTTTTCPPSALVNPEAKAMPGTSTPSTTASTTTRLSRTRRPLGRCAGRTGRSPTVDGDGFGDFTGTVSPAAGSADAAADCTTARCSAGGRRPGHPLVEQGAHGGRRLRGAVQ